MCLYSLDGRDVSESYSLMHPKGQDNVYIADKKDVVKKQLEFDF
jgi:hypothetical protein